MTNCLAMRLLLLRFWLVFNLAEDSDEIDIFGAICTVLAFPLNVTAWITNMTTINAVLSIVMSVLSILWLIMRVYREWDATKDHITKKIRTPDEAQQP